MIIVLILEQEILRLNLVYNSLDNNNDLIGTGSNYTFLGSNKGGWVIRRFDSGIKFSYQYNSSWVFENTFGSEGSRDKWNHIAITREGSTIRCFSNGVKGSDYTSSADIEYQQRVTVE